MKIEFKEEVIKVVTEKQIHLTLSMQEAAIVRWVLGISGGNDGYRIFNKLDDLVRQNGDINDVGDLMVPEGPLGSAKEKAK